MTNILVVLKDFFCKIIGFEVVFIDSDFESGSLKNLVPGSITDLGFCSGLAFTPSPCLEKPNKAHECNLDGLINSWIQLKRIWKEP